MNILYYMNSNNEIQIFVKTDKGTIVQILSIYSTIEDLLNEVSKRTKIPTKNLYLTYTSKILDNKKTLDDYNISSDSTIISHIRINSIISNTSNSQNLTN